AKLLRILEGHPYLAVGGTKEIHVDVHVISATNRDLSEFVEAKKFREDLYYRLNVFEIEIPPLRERGLDIELLARFFLEKFKQLNNRNYVEFSEEAVLALLNYDWPGNVRQLRNVIENAVVLAEDWKIRPEDLKLRTGQRSNKQQSIIRIDPSPTDNGVPELSINTFAPIPFIGDPTERSIEPEHFDTLEVSVWQERLIKEALRRTKGDIPAAADLLGMARSTLYRRLEKGLSDAV
ncbi:MAG: sigma 54-interacting transcriptional regulator, partial [Pirellulaceae bacterium]